MRIGSAPVEQEITLDDTNEFVEMQDVAAGEKPAKDNYAVRIKGPEDYVVFIQAGTEIAPEFRDANGDKLDDSTRVKFVKCNKQGDPLSEFLLNELLGRFVYDKMRVDSDYFKRVNRDLMLDEREIAKIFVEIPSAANGFNASQSRLTIGDHVADFGTPVEIIDQDDLAPSEKQAVKTASQRGN